MIESFRISAIRTDRSYLYTSIYTVAFDILIGNRRSNRTLRDINYFLQSIN